MEKPPKRIGNNFFMNYLLVRSVLAFQLLAWLTMPLAHSRAAEVRTVEQWGVFEIALRGPTNENPFTEVQFSARFTQGDSTIEANGFYDGDGVYRIRFMPEQQGEWHYLTTSSSAELKGKTGAFTVTKPSPENHGPVRVANTHHFAYADGTPYKELGTTCYAWTHQTRELEEQTLKTLSTAPFNKLRMCIFPKRFTWVENEPLLYPFEGVATTNWDFTRLNPKYFQHLEQRILDLQKLGIEADLILFHPYDKGHWGFDRMGAAADDRYLRYVVARLAAYRNVWWSLANEWDFQKEKKESDFVRFGEIVSRDDPYHHLLSIHNGRDIFNNTLPWITHVSVQCGGGAQDPGRAELFRGIFRKPAVFDELKYEGNTPRRWANLSGEEEVFRFWNVTVAGAYGGHSELYLNPEDHDIMWWSKGGVLKGQSPARLAFLKQVLADSPPDGIDPSDKWQDPRIGGQPAQYYLIYFGKEQPTNWVFNLPKANLREMVEGLKFKIEIIDTWDMTVTPVEGIFTTKNKDGYNLKDAYDRSVTLPGKPYMALRLKRVKE
jgi:hypothetical protein